jgi:hypothetical protein
MASQFDMTKLRASVKRLRPYVNKTRDELITTAARGFVKDVVAITPPSNGATKGTAAKKAGEATIAGDVGRIFQPMSEQGIEQFRTLYGDERQESFGHKGAKALGTIRAKVLAFGQMADWHRRRRRKDGRVMQINRDATTGLRKRDLAGLDIGIVTSADFKRFILLLQRNVGILAAGWNAAAEKLKVNLPAWIKRHGTGGGNIVEVTAAGRFRLELSNEVPFVGNVRAYERRVQRAIDFQAKKMDKQADFLIKKAIKEAGL